MKYSQPPAPPIRLQVMNMQTNEVRMLADHMGHDLNIHTNIYSLPSTIIEKAKVAKILYSVSTGNFSKCSKPTDFRDVTIPNIHIPQGEIQTTLIFACIQVNSGAGSPP